jgi:hypothetical protein
MPALDVGSLPCVRCGHSSYLHACVHNDTFVSADGALISECHYGACTYVDGDTLMTCPCDMWDPDRLSHVTALLGLDVRSVVG